MVVLVAMCDYTFKLKVRTNILLQKRVSLNVLPPVFLSKPPRGVIAERSCLYIVFNYKQFIFLWPFALLVPILLKQNKRTKLTKQTKQSRDLVCLCAVQLSVSYSAYTISPFLTLQ